MIVTLSEQARSRPKAEVTADINALLKDVNSKLDEPRKLPAPSWLTVSDPWY